MDELGLPEEPSYAEGTHYVTSFDDQILSYDFLSATTLGGLRHTLPSPAVIEIVKREFFRHVVLYSFSRQRVEQWSDADVLSNRSHIFCIPMSLKQNLSKTWGN
jgi:hypothetical protein